MEFGAAPVHRPGRLKAMPAFVPPDVEGAAAAAEYMLEAVEAAEAAESPIAQRLRLKLGECDAALGAETSRWDFAPRRRVAAIDYDDGTSAPRIRFGRAQHSPREGIMDWGCSPISAGNAGKAKYEAGISKPKMLSPRGPSSPNREGRSPRGPSSPARDGRGMNAAQLLESQRLKRRTRAAEAVLQQALPPKTAPASDWGFEVRWDTAVLDREGEEGRSCLSRAGLITRAEWRRRQPVGIVPAHSEAEKRAETRAHSDATPRGGHAATPGAVYTLNCGVISAVPEPTIVALLDDWSDTIDLSNYGIGDRLMAWVFAEPLAMKNATQLDLSGNRLGWRGADKVAKALIAAPHCRLAVLDLSQNALAASSPKNVHALVDLVTARARPTLQRLKLHNCGMGSAALATLFRGWSVGESPKRLPRAPSSVGGAALRRLDLSRNCLHIEAASLLESLLEPGGGLCGLRSLSLSWTQLRGAAAMAVGRGAGSSTSLQTLDLSWNALGSREGTSEAASFVATSVLASTSLTHLDVSFNRLSKGDLVFFSKSLKDNHTLVGLHVGGNDVPVRQDADGFFVAEDAPGKVKQSKEVSQGLQSAHVFTRILEKRHQATCASGQWAAGSGCWVCDKWSEVLFRYLPTTPAPAKVFVRCAFDAWQLAPLELVNGAFERWRMVPPGNQQFCYTVVAADGAELDVTVRESARAPVSFALPTTMGTRLAIGMAEPPQTVNVLHVCIREDDCGLDFFVPRRPGEKAAVATKARWSVATSVFAAYAADTTQSLTSVFEFDYACISKQKLFGGAHVEAEAKAALRACHDDLTTVFRLHCVLSKEVHTVGWNSWTAFVDDCFKQSTASALNRADVDMAILAESDLALRPSCRPLTGVRFLLAGVRSLLTGVFFAACTAGSVEGDARLNPKKSLCRFQFADAAARVAHLRWCKTGECGAVEAMRRLREAVSSLVDRYHDPPPFQRRYWVEAIDISLKADDALETAFSQYSGAEDAVGTLKGKRRMGYAEWASFVDVIGVITDGTATERDAKTAFLRAAPVHRDERAFQGALRRLSFIEFIQAVLRLADAAATAGADPEDLAMTLLDRVAAHFSKFSKTRFPKTFQQSNSRSSLDSPLAA